MLQTLTWLPGQLNLGPRPDRLDRQDAPMPWIDHVPPEAATGELAALYERISATRGGVAAVHQSQSLNPQAMETHLALYRAVVFRKSPLSRRQRERIAVLVSATNGCDYCVAHHGEALRRLGEEDDVLDALSAGGVPESLGAADTALLTWVRGLTLEPAARSEAELVHLRDLGFGDRALLDATLVCSYFNFVNRLVLGLGVELEEGFEETCG